MRHLLKKLPSILLILVGLSILGYISLSLDFNQVLKSLQKLSLPRLGGILFFVFLTVLARVFRWKFLINKITNNNVSWKFSFTSFLTGFSLGSFTLGRIGELAKPFLLKNAYGVPVAKSLPIVFLERIFDFLSLALFFFLSLFFLSFQNTTYQYLGVASGVLFFFILAILFVLPRSIYKTVFFISNKFIHTPHWSKKVHDLNEAVYFSLSMLKKKDVLMVIVLSTIASMILEYSRIYVLFKWLGSAVPFTVLMFSFTGSVLFGQITSIPGGIGVTEASQIVLLTSFVGTAKGEILKNGVLIDRLLTYYLLASIGALLLLIRKMGIGRFYKASTKIDKQ